MKLQPWTLVGTTGLQGNSDPSQGVDPPPGPRLSPDSCSRMFIGRTDAEAPSLWPRDVKSRLTGKDTDAGKD